MYTKTHEVMLEREIKKLKKDIQNKKIYSTGEVLQEMRILYDNKINCLFEEITRLKSRIEELELCLAEGNEDAR